MPLARVTMQKAAPPQTQRTGPEPRNTAQSLRRDCNLKRVTFGILDCRARQIESGRKERSADYFMPALLAKPATVSSERRRRRHARYRISAPVAVVLLAGTSYQRLEGHGRDLSEAGIGILLAAELEGGEVVSLRFCLPDGPWEARAVLRHRRGYHYGFEFLSITREQRISLARYFHTLPGID